VNSDIFKIFSYINIGIAVDTSDDLVVPVLKNVEKMSLYEA
jgi:pyruvate/2-oxoglutarate dehydrogenase complex dihydrolipoamide acyltransferase (E2) component